MKQMDMPQGDIIPLAGIESIKRKGNPAELAHPLFLDLGVDYQNTMSETIVGTKFGDRPVHEHSMGQTLHAEVQLFEWKTIGFGIRDENTRYLRQQPQRRTGVEPLGLFVIASNDDDRRPVSDCNRRICRKQKVTIALEGRTE
jgi:hypothetical protein